MMSFTKANSLKIITKYKKTLVPEFYYFEKNYFLKNKSRVIKKIKKRFDTDIIIRSSAVNEDSQKKSNAGFYDSHVIYKKNFHQIEVKIIKLIRKFKKNNDQILVQKFIRDPQIAGVIFTKDKRPVEGSSTVVRDPHEPVYPEGEEEKQKEEIEGNALPNAANSEMEWIGPAASDSWDKVPFPEEDEQSSNIRKNNIMTPKATCGAHPRRLGSCPVTRTASRQT